MKDALDPERVFALVVGIESYQVSRRWSLPGPAHDAERFADWLTSTAGVPQTNVHVLVSPLGQNHAGAHQPATHEHVSRLLFDELPKCDGDLLWIYWAGHGYVDPKDQMLLPCTDATASRTRHLNLSAALRWWRSSNVPAGRFRRVVAVSDACRVETRRASALKFGADEPEAGDIDNERRQLVLLAARPGQAAKNDPERQAGQFTHTLLKRLTGLSVDESVENLVEIARAVQMDFQLMTASGQAWQEPEFVIERGWNGSSLFGDCWAEKTADAVAGPVGAAKLDQRAWTELGSLFPSSSLPAYTYDAYRWAFEVTGCAVPPGEVLPADHLLDIVRDLNGRQGTQHGLPLALPFVRYLAARAAKTAADWAAEADAWVDRTRERLDTAPVPAPPDRAAERPALHVRLWSDDGIRYWTRMWLYQKAFESVWESGEPLELDAVRVALVEQLTARRAHAPSRVEFHVPYELLEEPFEAWPIPWRGSRTTRLGCGYEVVLRCPDEREGLAEGPWHRKWAWLKAQGDRHPQAVREVCDGDVSEQLGSLLQESDPPVVVLAEVAESVIMDTLDAVLDGGVPIAVWRRPADLQEETAESIRTALAVDAGTFEVRTLPGRLRSAQIKRRSLALMWDDPWRLPERQTLR
ncbi:caspase family protein [Streptomyces tauricus]|uniref:Caspase family protein n=1 Tax=Streptomyces tauricus TaxID=68274 RepID=A0ABZ1J9B7_9ACTN|nr:hypothetical protein [Streptomyces tauricus]